MTVRNSFTNTRLTDAETIAGWSSIGSGPGGAAEGAFYYQNALLFNRKVTASTGAGFAYTHGSNVNLSDGLNALILKAIVTDYGGLQPTDGLRVRIGSSSGDYMVGILAGSNSPIPARQSYPARGGFLIQPVDPSVVGYRDTVTGTPVYTAINYIGLVAAFATASAKSENVGLDAIDYGKGLELHTSGDLVDLVTHDEGIITNRFGYAFTLARNVYGLIGTMFVGKNGGSAVATIIADLARQTYIHRDGMFAADFAGWQFDYSAATSDIEIANKTFSGLGSSVTADTRNIMTFIAGSGVCDFHDNIVDNHAKITLDSELTFSDNKVTNSEGITQNGATVIGNSFSGSPVAALSAMMAISDLSLVTLNSIVSGGTGYAFDLGNFGANTSLTWNNTLSGYVAGTAGAGVDDKTPTGNEALVVDVDSGFTLTINVADGATIPSVANIGLGDVDVVAGLNTLTINGLIAGQSKVRVRDGSVTLPAGLADPNATAQFTMSFSAYASPNVVEYSVVTPGFVTEVAQLELFNVDVTVNLELEPDSSWIP